ncbi:GSCOCG00002678001-RA-CDS, partial [Cotesia congregata]
FSNNFHVKKNKNKIVLIKFSTCNYSINCTNKKHYLRKSFVKSHERLLSIRICNNHIILLNL